MRIRNKPDVEDDVRIERQPELVPERDNCGRQTFDGSSQLEAAGDLGPQLANRQVRSVDDQVGTVPKSAHELALTLNSHLDVIVGGEWMTPAVGVEAPGQGLVRRFEEEQPVVANITAELR